MERASLKELEKDTYARLVREWRAWNASILPEIKESYTENFTGDHLADYIGAKKTEGLPDIPAPSNDQ